MTDDSNFKQSPRGAQRLADVFFTQHSAEQDIMAANAEAEPEMTKKRNPPVGLVYSTDPSVHIGAKPEIEVQTLPPGEQTLRVRLETKQRAGKAVTVVAGFIGSAADLDTLGKNLKGYCGTGGSAKDGAILIQGDQREKVLGWLAKSGYGKARLG
jgi:translation initiation factor 1